MPAPSFDPSQVREAFPILATEIYGAPLVYLDNAATTQKPRPVLEAMHRFLTRYNATTLRSAHYLANRTYQEIEAVRRKAASWIGALQEEEIVFTAGTTASINLVADAYGREEIGKGDEVVVSTWEHHSNFLPWRRLCTEKEATLQVAPILPEGTTDQASFEASLSPRTKVVALTYVSNVLGTVHPLESMIAAVRRQAPEAIVVIDAAQAAGHLPINVQALGCDFLAFSSHKMYGPPGVGVLYGRKALLDKMDPWQLGGGMVENVIEGPHYSSTPYKFEAGTPNTASIVGFGAAIDFLQSLDSRAIAQHEQTLVTAAVEALQELSPIRVLAPDCFKPSLFSFLAKGLHPLDLGAQLDSRGIAVRTGHHCAAPLTHALGVPGTVRASFALYNTVEEVARLVEALRAILKRSNLA